jgi:hypothetical protein
MAETGGGQLARMVQDLATTTTKMQEVSGNLQSYLLDQKYMREDLANVRVLVNNLTILLRDGDGSPSLVTRVYLVEETLKEVRAGQLRTRDWWLKVVASLVAASILTVVGFGLWLYASTKGNIIHP